MAEVERRRMELKYCECCGGLLLRPAGTGAVYCAACRARLEKLAPPRPQKHRGRKSRNEEQTVSSGMPETSAMEVIEAAAMPGPMAVEGNEAWGWA